MNRRPSAPNIPGANGTSVCSAFKRSLSGRQRHLQPHFDLRCDVQQPIDVSNTSDQIEVNPIILDTPSGKRHVTWYDANGQRVAHSVAYSLPKVPERPHERRLSPTVNR